MEPLAAVLPPPEDRPSVRAQRNLADAAAVVRFVYASDVNLDAVDDDTKPGVYAER